MAAKTLILLQARKEELAQENEGLRNDLRSDMEQLEPAMGMVEKGYELARTAGSVWNMTSVFRSEKKGSAVSKLLFDFVRSRLS